MKRCKALSLSGSTDMATKSALFLMWAALASHGPPPWIQPQQELLAVTNDLLKVYDCTTYPVEGPPHPCKFTLTVVYGTKDQNAGISGNAILVTRPLLLSMNRDEMAFVIGHELAHHAKAKSETAADIYGAALAKAAGFDYCRGARVLLRFRGGGKHPPGKVRLAAIGCDS